MSGGKGGNTKSTNRDFLYATLAIVGGLIIVFWAWRGYLQGQQENLRQNTYLSGEFSAQQFSSTVKSNIRALENLKGRIEVTSGEYFQYWSYDANVILEQNPSFRFIEWIDSNMVIQRIEPLKGNRAAIHLDINTVDNRGEEWLSHVSDSLTNFTRWQTLTQGDTAFLVDAPVYYDGRFQGSITAGMDFTEQFDQMLSGTEDFSVLIADETGEVFYRYNTPDLQAVPANFVFQKDLMFDLADKKTWKFYFLPRPALVQQREYVSGLPGLIMGALISFLLGIIVFYSQRSRQEAARVRTINTKLKTLNVEISEERLRAEKASQTKTEFLSNMSHEIRTPLNAILGFIEILKGMEMEQDRLKYLQMMDFSSKNLLSLVNDILEIDKIESGKLSLRNEVFSPKGELKSLLQTFSPGFYEKGLVLEKQLPDGAGQMALGDMGKFNQIFTNLLRNSFKFTHEGKVEVQYQEEIRNDKVFVEVRIKDTGIGIPADKLSTIFDRFAQVDSSLRKKHEGSGLGLAITYQLVKMMGGSIKASSEDGKGSEFVVKLEMATAVETVRNTESLDGEDQGFKGRKILIVEDNAMNIMVLKKVLEQLKIETDVAENGIEAIDKVAQNSYDLVFMDIHMPEMDGFEATRALRRQNYELPIVGLSANVTKEAVEESRQAGMQDYMTKPFSREKLVQLLLRYLA